MMIDLRKSLRTFTVWLGAEACDVIASSFDLQSDNQVVFYDGFERKIAAFTKWDKITSNEKTPSE